MLNEKKFETPDELEINYDEKYNLDKFISAIESSLKTDPDIFSETWEYNTNSADKNEIKTDAENVRSRCYKTISLDTCNYLSKSVRNPDNTTFYNFSGFDVGKLGKLRLLKNEVFITALMGEVGIGPKVYDYSFDEFIMQYLPFMTLDAYLKTKPFTFSLFQEIAMTISKMHSYQVCHNDLHPKNILVSSLDSRNLDGNKFKIYIIDFEDAFIHDPGYVCPRDYDRIFNLFFDSKNIYVPQELKELKKLKSELQEWYERMGVKFNLPDFYKFLHNEIHLSTEKSKN
jgi:predicted Ser/Thr protein kinase